MCSEIYDNPNFHFPDDLNAYLVWDFEENKKFKGLILSFHLNS